MSPKKVEDERIKFSRRVLPIKTSQKDAELEQGIIVNLMEIYESYKHILIDEDSIGNDNPVDDFVEVYGLTVFSTNPRRKSNPEYFTLTKQVQEHFGDIQITKDVDEETQKQVQEYFGDGETITLTGTITPEGVVSIPGLMEPKPNQTKTAENHPDFEKERTKWVKRLVLVIGFEEWNIHPFTDSIKNHIIDKLADTKDNDSLQDAYEEVLAQFKSLDVSALLDMIEKFEERANEGLFKTSLPKWAKGNNIRHEYQSYARELLSRQGYLEKLNKEYENGEIILINYNKRKG